jgi:DNA-binding transcriptional LysR family regulator
LTAWAGHRLLIRVLIWADHGSRERSLPDEVSSYQAIIDLLLAAGMTDMRMQEIEHPLTALALASANADFAFVPASAQELSARGVVFRPLKADVPPLETVALWSNASPDPLVPRVLDILRRWGSEKKKASSQPNQRGKVKLFAR